MIEKNLKKNKIKSNEPTTLVYQNDGSCVISESQVIARVSRGKDLEKKIILKKNSVLVGTDKKADFVLSDPSISRQHLSMKLAGNAVEITDLNSTNGTFVAKSRIKSANVPIGSTISIGETDIEIFTQTQSFSPTISKRKRFGDLVGSSGAMKRLYFILERIADSDITVLIEGETGTGKELAARALHQKSHRQAKPFHIVDCGAVSPTLIEAELFGHVKGSFTGADRDRTGAFEIAEGGTLLFDEIGELPLSLQPKLLRALENREIRPVGTSQSIKIDVRFIAATNKILQKEVNKGLFREDLFYRLNVFKVQMPPLRNRRDDIQRLVEHFSGASFHPAFTEELLSRMTGHSWPGNVRELKNAVERYIVLSGKTHQSYSKNEIDKKPRTAASDLDIMELLDMDIQKPFKQAKGEIVTVFETAYISKALAKTKGNISACARLAKIDRKHMERLIKKNTIDVKSFQPG